jgi:hypothetical protein
MGTHLLWNFFTISVSKGFISGYINFLTQEKFYFNSDKTVPGLGFMKIWTITHNQNKIARIFALYTTPKIDKLHKVLVIC